MSCQPLFKHCPMSFKYTFAPKAECLLCSMICPALDGTRTLLCHLGRSHMLIILIYCILIMAFSKTHALVLQISFWAAGIQHRGEQRTKFAFQASSFIFRFNRFRVLVAGFVAFGFLRGEFGWHRGFFDHFDGLWCCFPSPSFHQLVLEMIDLYIKNHMPCHKNAWSRLSLPRSEADLSQITSTSPLLLVLILTGEKVGRLKVNCLLYPPHTSLPEQCAWVVQAVPITFILLAQMHILWGQRLIKYPQPSKEAHINGEIIGHESRIHYFKEKTVSLEIAEGCESPS